MRNRGLTDEADPFFFSENDEMDYSADLYKLTYDFVRDYPPAQYPELLYKLERPFTCLLIDTHKDYFICIPFRSNIRHDDAYMFRKSLRSRRTKSGLDYTKIVLVNDGKYLNSEDIYVDQDEYEEVRSNLPRIVDEAVGYVDGYIGHITGISPLYAREFERRYRYSTLPYFHDIMGI